VVKNKDEPGSEKKIFETGPEPEKNKSSDPGSGLDIPAAPYSKAIPWDRYSHISKCDKENFS